MVELLVAIALSAIVMGSLMAVFFGAKTSFQSTSGLGNLTESGRFAVDFITRTTRGAGVMGCAPTAATDVSNLNLNTTLPLNFAQPLGGYEASNTAPGNVVVLPAVPATGGAYLPALDPILAALVPAPVTGSDILIVRTTMGQAAGMYVTAIADGTVAFTVNNATIAIPGPGTLTAGGLALISDCAKSTVFEVTGVAGNSISHVVGGAAPGNATGPFLASYGNGAFVYVPDTIVYYIGVGADGFGALYSVDLNGTGAFGVPQELVSDIDNMQVLFGVDTVGNGGVTQYFKAQDVADFNTVVSVKVALLVSSPANVLPPPTPTVATSYQLLGTTVTAPLDRRARKVFETTIAIRAKAT